MKSDWFVFKCDRCGAYVWDYPYWREFIECRECGGVSHFVGANCVSRTVDGVKTGMVVPPEMLAKPGELK